MPDHAIGIEINGMTKRFGSFAALDNVLMTPHMSGWTAGTVRRRQETLADNIGRLRRGEALIHVLHGPA